MRRENGFTLMETLIALVLMSLLLLALFGGFRAGIASWRLVDRHVDANEPQLRLDRMLYRHLSQLKLQGEGRSFTGATVAENTFMIATRDTIHYAAPLALSADNEVHSIELISQPAGRAGLWMRTAPYDENVNMVEVLKDVDYVQLNDSISVKFSYFVEGEWHDALEEGVNPELLRVYWQAGQRVWSSSTYAVIGH